MREGIGGAMLMYLIIPIVILFIFFVAFVINYAAAYRSANYIVTQIEMCEGADFDNCAHTSSEIIKEFVRTKYHYLREIDPPECNSNTRGAYWTVTLQVEMEIPIVGAVGLYDVRAETKTIYGGTCKTY